MNRDQQMNMRVHPATKNAALRMAKEDGRSLTNFIEHLILAEAKRRTLVAKKAA